MKGMARKDTAMPDEATQPARRRLLAALGRIGAGTAAGSVIAVAAFSTAITVLGQASVANATAALIGMFTGIFGNVAADLVRDLMEYATGAGEEDEKLAALQRQFEALAPRLDDLATRTQLEEVLAGHDALQNTLRLALEEQRIDLAEHIARIMAENTWLLRQEVAAQMGRLLAEFRHLARQEDIARLEAAIRRLEVSYGIRIEMTMTESVGGMQVGIVQGNLIVQQPGQPLQPLPVPPPDRLFGRDTMCRQIGEALAAGGRVLLHGGPGFGKTAIAATLARDWLAAQPERAVLWLPVGRGAGLTAMLSSIGSAFGAETGRAMAAAVRDEDRLGMARRLLSRCALVVLDDCWDGPALATLLQNGLPPGLAALVTSRTHFPINLAFEVDRLLRPDARDLLRHHAGRDLPQDQADALCDLLGDHAYAVEIAGAWLADPSMTIPELMDRVAAQPHDLPMPEGFAQAGRESVGRLLAASVAALEGSAKAEEREAARAFWAWGALFAPRATPELLALALHPPSAIPDLAAYFPAGAVPDATDADLHAAQDALRLLDRRSLARYVEAAPYCAAYYEMHDLTFSFAAQPATDDQRERAVAACVACARRHAHKPNTPEGVAHHHALEAALPNLLEAAQWAAARGLHGAVNHLGGDLYGSSDFLFVRGRSAEALALLSLALAAARALGLRRDEGVHLGSLGIAYASLGRYDEAIERYQQALAIARQIGDRGGEGRHLGNLGIAYFSLGRYDEAIAHHEQALAIARQIGDRGGEGRHLGNLGIAYFSLGRYDEAIAHHEQALAIARQIGDRRGEGNALGSLGSAYASLGRYEEAIAHFQQALVIRREIDDQGGEAIDLFNIGLLHAQQGDLSAALDSLQAARTIFQALGTTHLVQQADEVIARVRAALTVSGGE